MEEGSVVAALVAMGFVMVGLFQYLKGYITSSNKDYIDLRTKYEGLQALKLELERNNLYWKNKALLATQKNKAYRRKLSRCHEAIQASLIKTQPIPDLSDDDTIVPELKKN